MDGGMTYSDSLSPSKQGKSPYVSTTSHFPFATATAAPVGVARSVTKIHQEQLFQTASISHLPPDVAQLPNTSAAAPAATQPSITATNCYVGIVVTLLVVYAVVAMAAMLRRFYYASPFWYEREPSDAAKGSELNLFAMLFSCVGVHSVLSHHVYLSALLPPSSTLECLVYHAVTCASHVTVLAAIYSALTFAFNVDSVAAEVGVGALAAVVATLLVKAFFQGYGRQPTTNVAAAVFQALYAKNVSHGSSTTNYFDEPSNIDETFLHDDFSVRGGYYELPIVVSSGSTQIPGHIGWGGNNVDDDGYADEEIDVQSVRWASSSNLMQGRSSSYRAASIPAANRFEFPVDVNAASPGADADYFLEDVDVQSLSTASWMFADCGAAPSHAPQKLPEAVPIAIAASDSHNTPHSTPDPHKQELGASDINLHNRSSTQEKKDHNIDGNIDKVTEKEVISHEDSSSSHNHSTHNNSHQSSKEDDNSIKWRSRKVSVTWAASPPETSHDQSSNCFVAANVDHQHASFAEQAGRSGVRHGGGSYDPSSTDSKAQLQNVHQIRAVHVAFLVAVFIATVLLRKLSDDRHRCSSSFTTSFLIVLFVVDGVLLQTLCAAAVVGFLRLQSTCPPSCTSQDSTAFDEEV